jgi:uncharacterized protein YycO
MKIAFYVAKYGTAFDKWISWVTWGKYSHCELVFSDDMWCSSSPRDGGVRFKNIEFAPEHWDFVDLKKKYQWSTSISVSFEAIVRQWCETQVGHPYDWKGVYGFILPRFLRQNNEAWFCSEFCVKALNKIGLYGNLISWETTPNNLYRAIKKSKKLLV